MSVSASLLNDSYINTDTERSEENNKPLSFFDWNRNKTKKVQSASKILLAPSNTNNREPTTAQEAGQQCVKLKANSYLLEPLMEKENGSKVQKINKVLKRYDSFL